MNDYEMNIVRQAINDACQYWGSGSSLNNPYGLKQTLQKKLEEIRNCQGKHTNDAQALLNLATTACLIRIAIGWLDHTYHL